VQSAARTVWSLTMSTQACFPSMKPLGMALGVRISYLGEKADERIYVCPTHASPLGGMLGTALSFGVPLSELLEDDAVGEALSADTDALQHTVAPQLVQDQVGIQFTSLGTENVYR